MDQIIHQFMEFQRRILLNMAEIAQIHVNKVSLSTEFGFMQHGSASQRLAAVAEEGGEVGIFIMYQIHICFIFS